VVFGRRVDRCRLGFAGGARSVSTPPPRIRYSGSPSWRRRRVSLRSRGSRFPRRDRRGDDEDLVGGFCFSSSSSSRPRHVGVSSAVVEKTRFVQELSSLASSGWRWSSRWRGPCWVAGPWQADLVLSLDVGRRGWPDLEVDEELGAGPRPTSPNDKVCISGAPLLRF
jgi:hypothetical protein